MAIETKRNFAARTGTNLRGKKMKRLFATMLTATCAAAPLGIMPAAPAQAQAVTRPTSDVVLSIGRGELITVPGSMTDIFIANEAIADVQVKSERQLYVFGKSGGTTTVYASNAAGDIIWSADVRVGSNIDSVDQMLALAMPEAQISVATIGSNTVLLTGTIAAPEDAAEAERLVAAFVGEDANVISRLRMATPLQVNLQVRFAEVSRSLVRTLGTNLLSQDSSDGFQFGIAQGRGTGASISDEGVFQAGGSGQGTTLAGFGQFLGLDLTGALDLAERQGLVTTLSQPNLTALSGETASFLAGGEFPIPISQGLGTTTIEYRNFGVSLSYTPYVLANGRISLRVRPEVSELSTQGAVTLNGFQVPSLTIRRAETTVELGSGQSFMIAGLMSNNAQSQIEKAPGLGDLPILGNLFRSTDFRSGQTELVIIVTPYLVNPVNARDIALPTDGYRSPNLAQQLILNREQDGVSGATRPMPTQSTTGGATPAVGPAAGSAATNTQSAPARNSASLPTPGFSLND